MAARKRRTTPRPDPDQQMLFPNQEQLLEGLDEKARKELRSLMAELLLEAAQCQMPEGDDDE